MHLFKENVQLIICLIWLLGNFKLNICLIFLLGGTYIEGGESNPFGERKRIFSSSLESDVI